MAKNSGGPLACAVNANSRSDTLVLPPSLPPSFRPSVRPSSSDKLRLVAASTCYLSAARCVLTPQGRTPIKMKWQEIVAVSISDGTDHIIMTLSATAVLRSCDAAGSEKNKLGWVG